MIYDINGTQYSLSSADIEVQGYQVMGTSELKLGEKLEPGEVEGQSSVPVGWTRGAWSGEGSLKLPLSEGLDMKANMGNEYMTRVWTGTFTFTELNGPGVMTIEVLGARFKAFDIDGGDRTKPSTDALPFMLTQPCLANGVKAVEPNPNGGAGSFTISFSV